MWTPVTVDSATNTVYFGTGSATPLYFPALRPGATPRTDSLIAVDLTTGRLKWWQQLIAGNQWAYDVSQPPLVYEARSEARATTSSPWRPWRASGSRSTQRPGAVPRAREGHRPRGASALSPGRARDCLPVVARRPQLLARLVRSRPPTTSSTLQPRRPPSSSSRSSRRRRSGASSFSGTSTSVSRTGTSAARSPAGTTTARSAPSTSRAVGECGSSGHRSPNAAA